jgi:RNA polymerase sigma factor (sigma-70 family)
LSRSEQQGGTAARCEADLASDGGFGHNRAVRALPEPPSASEAMDRDERLAERARSLRSTLARYFIRRRVPADDAEDLVQDVFLRVARRGSLAGIANVDAYLTSSAGSVLVDWHRRRSVREADAHVPFELEHHDTAVAAADEAIAAREELRLTTLHLLELPERTRTAFVLSRLEGLHYREIGARLGISPSAVEKHVAKALAHLLARAGAVS